MYVPANCRLVYTPFCPPFLQLLDDSYIQQHGMLSLQVLVVCAEFPELELRLQSFRKAGLKLSQKGEQAKQARKYKEQMVAAQDHDAGMKDRGPSDEERQSRPAPAEADTGGASVSEAVLSRLLAAHTSKVMKAVQDIDAKLIEQQAVLEAQQAAQADLAQKLSAMVDK